MFREANPDAPPEEAIQMIGEMTAKALKLEVTAKPAAKAAARTAPAKAAPRKPLAAGASSAAKPAASKAPNPWADLLDE